MNTLPQKAGPKSREEALFTRLEHGNCMKPTVAMQPLLYNVPECYIVLYNSPPLHPSPSISLVCTQRSASTKRDDEKEERKEGIGVESDYESSLRWIPYQILLFVFSRREMSV